MPERGGAPWFDDNTGFTVLRTNGELEFEELGGGPGGHNKFDFDLADLLPTLEDDDFVVAVVGVYLDNSSTQLWGVSMNHNDHHDRGMSEVGILDVKGFTLYEFGDTLADLGTGAQLSASQFDTDVGDTVHVVCLSMIIKDVERLPDGTGNPPLPGGGRFDSGGPVDRGTDAADDEFPFPDTDDHADMAPENTEGSNLWWTSALTENSVAGDQLVYVHNQLPPEGTTEGQDYEYALIDDVDPTDHTGMVGLAYTELVDCLVDPEAGLGQPPRWSTNGTVTTDWPGVVGGYLAFAAAAEEGWGIMSL